MYLIKLTQVSKAFVIKDTNTRREYTVTWRNYTPNPWFIEDEYEVEIDQETALGEDLIVLVQDQFDDWAK